MWCLPSSFGSIGLTAREEMSFEEFQGGRNGGGMEWVKQFWIPVSVWCLPSSFSSIGLMVWEEMLFEEFQDARHGGHLGYQNGTIFTILNVCVTVMPPIKFWLNPTYDLGGDVVWRTSRWPPWRPSWISERTILSILNLCVTVMPPIVLAQSDLRFGRRCRLKISRWRSSWISKRNDFSNSESLCHCDTSHQVLAQSDFRFRRRCHLKNFKINRTILAILNLCVTVMPIKFWLNPTYGLGGDVVWRISWRPSWISERNHFSKFESLSHCDASNQVSAQSDLWFGRKCRLKNFKMAAILDIGTERF